MKRLIRWLAAQSTAVDVTARPVVPVHHRRHTDTPLFDDELDLHCIDEPHVALTAEEVRRERVRLARMAVSTIGACVEAEEAAVLSPVEFTVVADIDGFRDSMVSLGAAFASVTSGRSW